MLGTLTDIVTIEARTRTESADGTGAVEIAWAARGQLWAEPSPLSPRESERQGSVRELQVYRFRVNAEGARALGVQTTDRVVWGGTNYAVRELRWPQRREVILDIIAETIGGIS